VHEQTLFQPNDLKKHYKFGDKAINKDDDSGFKGHPECAFCRSSFYGDDELFEHCRDKHEQCHICVRRGKRHEYYANYDQMVRSTLPILIKCIGNTPNQACHRRNISTGIIICANGAIVSTRSLLYSSQTLI
jgi:hypothetical protein